MVHVLTLLACTEKPISSTWIAGSVNTNPVVIRQIVGHLRDAGLVRTLPGSAGGAALNRPPKEIALSEVYRLVKEETFFRLHPSEPNPHCPVGRNIQGVLIEICAEMDDLIESALDQTSVADILDQVREKEAHKESM